MASRTQIRLEQLTGSAVDLKSEAQQYVTPAVASALTGSDVRDLFGMVGAALSRIHGADSDEPFNNTAGVLNQNTVISGSVTVKNNSDLTMFTVSSGIARATVGDDDYTGDALLTFRNNGTTTYTVGHDLSGDVFAINNSSAFDISGDNSFEIGASGDATFGANVTVSGDLTVNGDTTTVNTTNLTVQDSIIALGHSGSSFNNVGDRGILFARGANAASALPGFWWDGSRFNLATSTTGPSSGSFNPVTSYSDLQIGDLVIHDGVNRRGTLEIAASDLVLSSAAGNDLRLDSNSGKIFIDKDANSAGFLQADAGSNGLILSASVNDSLLLDSNAGLIQFGRAANETNGNKVGAIIGGGASTESFSFIKSDDVDDNNFTVQIESETNGDFEAQFLAVSGAVRYTAPSGSTNYVALVAPDTVGSSFTLHLPATDGNANEFLQTDGSGNLTFAAPSEASSNSAKAVLKVRSGVTITAGQDNLILTGSGTEVASKLFEPIGNLSATLGNQSALANADAFKLLEVYVNGQLLTSGSHVAGGVPTGGDYAIISRAAGLNSQQISGSFAFDLEADDIITLIRKV